MKKKLFIIMIMLLTLSTIGFAQQSTIPTFDQEKNNIVVTRQQTQFTIRLTSNPTTGYKWFLKTYDKRLLVLMEHHFAASRNKVLMGAGGYEFWTFRMRPLAFRVPQETVIQFFYARPWEKKQGEPVNFVVSSNSAT